jgi:hypothetical protein
LLVGTAAILLSLAALVVSVVQTRILAAQQRAAVWPRLQLDMSHLDDNFSVVLSNAGVGPAIVRSVEMRVHGRAYPTMWRLAQSEVMPAMGDRLDATPRFYSDVVPGAVLRPGDETNPLLTQRNETLARRLTALTADTSFHARIGYSDVYGACWMLDNDTVRAAGRCASAEG